MLRLSISLCFFPLFEYACLADRSLGGRCLLRYSCSSIPNRPSGSIRCLDLIRGGWLSSRSKILPLGIRPVGVQFNALNQSNLGLASCLRMGFELDTGPSRFWSSYGRWCFHGCSDSVAVLTVLLLPNVAALLLFFSFLRVQYFPLA